MKPRLVIVGDALLDVTVDGSAERICPDAPVPVVDETSRAARPGGAGLAALLAAATGTATTLVTAIGEDEAGARLEALLRAAGVDVRSTELQAPTPQKVRVRAAGQTVLRLDRGANTGAADIGPFDDALLSAVGGADAVLVADYGRGIAASEPLRRTLAGAVGSKPVVWDPHPLGPPPVQGSWLVTPNEREAAAAAGVGGPATLRRAAVAGRRLLEQWSPRAVVVTRGDRGAVLLAGNGPALAMPVHPVQGDPCGAGDCFAVAAALALGDGALMSEAVGAACAAAGRYVADGALGPTGLRGEPASSRSGAAAELDGARQLVEDVRSKGGTVVATGGCFDLLHAGHVSLLHQARALGDCLVVCLNSDASVRALKGEGRPLVAQEDRARVLAAVSSVDAVVTFDEADPRVLLSHLRPDVFVKGGDYAALDLVEGAAMASWGGEVVVVPYLDGRSTTQLISEARSHV